MLNRKSDKNEFELTCFYILFSSQIEFKTFRTISSISMESVSSRLLELPSRIRSNHTDRFKPVSVITNHFEVIVEKKLSQIYIFKVMFTPKIPENNTKLRMELLEKLPLESQIKQPVISGYQIFSPLEPIEKREYKINITLVKNYSLSKDKKLLLTFLNNGIRNIMSSLNYVEIGRSGKYFNRKDKMEIDSLTMFNGFKVNFVALEKSTFLRVDPAKKIVRNQTALNVIDNIYKRHKDKDKEQKRQFVKEAMIGQIVMSNYGKTQYYKISDVHFEDIMTIKLEDNQTLIDYYKEKYQIIIKNTKQPLLVADNRSKKDILLIPELMLMTGIPDDFDERRRKAISEKTIKDPSFKVKEIGGLIDQIKSQQKVEALKNLGIDMQFQMAKVGAKQIPIPTISLGKNNTVQQGRESQFNLSDKPIFKASHSVICSIIAHRNTDIKQFERILQKTASLLQVELKINYFYFSQSDEKRIKNQVDNACKQQTKICLIILPTHLRGQYSTIKKHSISEQEIVTQVILESTLKKKQLPSIATKILLQMTAKRGNILWVPKIDIENSIMLVGFQEAKIGGKTLLVITATLNSTFTMVCTYTKVYQDIKDKFEAMKTLLLQATAAYMKRNEEVPQEIICYQNSCPHDQVAGYQSFFVKTFKEQIQEIYKDKNIYLTVLMINVKTSERFFVMRDGRPENPPAGTLINQAIVSENYDFYIVSQKPTRGTAVPNHYQVIYSNSKMPEGILQQLCFSQCFNYVNWTGSIKVPSILQYARKGAKFHSEVLKEQSAPQSLTTRFYYI